MGLSDCGWRLLSPYRTSSAPGASTRMGSGWCPARQEEGVSVRYPCAANTAMFIYLAPDNAGKSPATLAGGSSTTWTGRWTSSSSRGVTFEQYDQPGLATDERGVFEGPGLRAAWVRDPDGNTLAVAEVEG